MVKASKRIPTPPTYRIDFVPCVTDEEVAALARRSGTSDCKRGKLQIQDLRTVKILCSLYHRNIQYYRCISASFVLFFTVYIYFVVTIMYFFVCLCMTNLTEVFQGFFLSCKANARVKPAKTGHSPHSS